MMSPIIYEWGNCGFKLCYIVMLCGSQASYFNYRHNQMNVASERGEAMNRAKKIIAEGNFESSKCSIDIWSDWFTVLIDAFWLLLTYVYGTWHIMRTSYSTSSIVDETDPVAAFAFSLDYANWLTDMVIAEELTRNMILAAVAVFVMTLLLIASISTCLMVLLCVVLTLVSGCIGFLISQRRCRTNRSQNIDYRCSDKIKSWHVERRHYSLWFKT